MSVTNVSVGQVELCDAVSGSSVKMWVCTETTAKEMLRLTSEVFAKPVSGFLTGDGLLIPASVISSDPTLFHDTSLFVVCAGEQTTELVAAHARRFMEETEDAEGDEQFDETLDDDLYDAPQNYDDEDLAYEPEVDVDAGQENNGGKRSLTLTRTEEELGEEDYLAQLDRENKQLQVPISPSAAALQAQSEEYEKLRQTWLTMKLEELMKVERDLEDAEEEAIAIRQLQQQQQRRQQSNTQSASNQYEDNDDASADAPFESHDDIDDPMLDDEDEYEQQMEQELSEAMERQRLAQATKRAVQNAANYPPQTPNSAAQSALQKAHALLAAAEQDEHQSDYVDEEDVEQSQYSRNQRDEGATKWEIEHSEFEEDEQPEQRLDDEAAEFFSDIEDSAVAEQRRRLNRLNAEEVRLRAMESQVRYQQRRLQLQQQEAEHALKALASPAKSPARPTVKSTPSSQLRSVPAVAQPAASAEDEKLSMPEHERRVAWYNHQMQLYKRQMQAHEHAIHDLKSQEEQLSNLLENGAEEDEEQYQQLLDLYAKLQEQQSRQQQLEEQQRLLSELQIELQTAAQLQHQRQVLHQAEQQASQAVFDQQTPREQTREELPPRPASATPKRAMRHNQQQ